MIYISNTIGQTMDIAYELGSQAGPSDIYCLDGELGAGKTVFSKGFAQGLGIHSHITSPTFTIINEYSNDQGLHLYHFDLYRIKDMAELYDMGMEDYLYGSGVCLIEWACLAGDFIKGQTTAISIYKDYEKGEDYREIHIKRQVSK